MSGYDNFFFKSCRQLKNLDASPNPADLCRNDY